MHSTVHQLMLIKGVRNNQTKYLHKITFCHPVHPLLGCFSSWIVVLSQNGHQSVSHAEEESDLTDPTRTHLSRT